MGPSAASAGDDLLRWVSETGSGTWDRLRDACAYVGRKHAVHRRPWIQASELSALGHIDIDWSARRWSVAPPALNLVPGLGLCIVLTGSRPHYIDRRFDEATDDLDVFPFEVPQGPAPAARFAKCASVAAAQHVADALETDLIIDPARALVAALRAADEVPIQLVPQPEMDEAQRFNTETLQWQPARTFEPGLYRVDLHGRPLHRRLDESGSWLEIDLPSGQFLSLRGRKEPALRWRPASRDNTSSPYLEVRRELVLPELAERAATVSSGFLPQVVAGWRRYRNVPEAMAEVIADRLFQKLERV
jgi:hypothetical protein